MTLYISVGRCTVDTQFCYEYAVERGTGDRFIVLCPVKNSACGCSPVTSFSWSHGTLMSKSTGHRKQRARGVGRAHGVLYVITSNCCIYSSHVVFWMTQFSNQKGNRLLDLCIIITFACRCDGNYWCCCCCCCCCFFPEEVPCRSSLCRPTRPVSERLAVMLQVLIVSVPRLNWVLYKD